MLWFSGDPEGSHWSAAGGFASKYLRSLGAGRHAASGTPAPNIGGFPQIDPDHSSSRSILNPNLRRREHRRQNRRRQTNCLLKSR